MKNNSGQAVLIVLLVVVVALGLGLSIVSQSTTDVKISKQEQEGSRAFNAAEAGIEDALKNITTAAPGGGWTDDDGITVEYDVTSKTVLQGEFEKNESIEVNLEGAVGLTELTINWGNGGCDGADDEDGETVASLLISVIDQDDNIRRFGYNACDLEDDNGLENIGGGGADGYLRGIGISVGSNDVLVRIRPLYNKVSIRVTGDADLPDQAYLINSRAQTDTLESKAIEVVRTNPAAPSIFDYALFSGQSIIKQ